MSWWKGQGATRSHQDLRKTKQRTGGEGGEEKREANVQEMLVSPAHSNAARDMGMLVSPSGEEDPASPPREGKENKEQVSATVDKAEKALGVLAGGQQTLMDENAQLEGSLKDANAQLAAKEDELAAQADELAAQRWALEEKSDALEALKEYNLLLKAQLADESNDDDDGSSDDGGDSVVERLRRLNVRLLVKNAWLQDALEKTRLELGNVIDANAMLRWQAEHEHAENLEFMGLTANENHGEGEGDGSGDGSGEEGGDKDDEEEQSAD